MEDSYDEDVAMSSPDEMSYAGRRRSGDESAEEEKDVDFGDDSDGEEQEQQYGEGRKKGQRKHVDTGARMYKSMVSKDVHSTVRRTNAGGVFSLPILRNALNDIIKVYGKDVIMAPTSRGEGDEEGVSKKDGPVILWGVPALQMIAAMLETNLRTILRASLVMASATGRQTVTVRHMTDAIAVRGGDTTAHLSAAEITALQKRVSLIKKGKLSDVQHRPTEEDVQQAFPKINTKDRSVNSVTVNIDKLVRPGVVVELRKQVAIRSMSSAMIGALRRLTQRYLQSVVARIVDLIAVKPKTRLITAKFVAAATGAKVLGVISTSRELENSAQRQERIEEKRVKEFQKDKEAAAAATP